MTAPNPKFIRKRVEQKISIKIICKKEDLHEELLKTAKKELREFVFIPGEHTFKSSVFIYADKVAVFHLQKEPYYVVVIDDKDFYDSEKTMFELIWKAYKK